MIGGDVPTVMNPYLISYTSGKFGWPSINFCGSKHGSVTSSRDEGPESKQLISNSAQVASVPSHHLWYPVNCMRVSIV